jgi:type II secretory pathway component GspD/PulD (secretin)
MIAKRMPMVAGIALTVVMPVLSGQANTAYAQSASTSASDSASAEHVEGGIPLSEVIAHVAKKTGKKFVLDSRVHGEVVLIGQDPGNVSYSDLLTILLVNHFAAFEQGGYVTVLPDAVVRQQSLPQVTGKESLPDSEFVSKVITIKYTSAAQLVPILRPILPQYAHLAALPCNNKLILVDTFAKVQRLQSIIDALDVGSEPYKLGSCDYRPPANEPAPSPIAPKAPAADHADSPPR